MVTYLDLLNKARRRNKQDDTTVALLNNKAAGTINNVEILDDVSSDVYGFSQDWDFTEYFETTTLVSGDGIVPTAGLSASMDVDSIKEVKYIKTTSLVPLQIISPSTAEDVLQGATNGEPKYWYTQKRVLKVAPLPNAAYQLRLIYHTIIPRITIDNIQSTVVLPKTVERGFVQMLYARLLEEDGDTAWEKEYAKGVRTVNQGFARNKAPQRKHGTKKFRVS